MEKHSSAPSCFRCVGGEKICNYCEGKMMKHGMSGAGKRRYKCSVCHKTQVAHYTYRACRPGINASIVALTKEGLGIRSTARVLQISTTTLLKRIQHIAKNISRPVIRKGQTYEVDELCTFVKQKSRRIWIVYALERESGQVAGFNTGMRTHKTLSRVLDTLKLSEADRIYTDGLKHYRHLINRSVHRVSRYATNRIERKNLSLRTHLKRLGRRTICFSRSLAVFPL